MNNRDSTWSRTFFVGLFAVVLIAATFVIGIRRGMDHVVVYSPDSEQVSLSIALSDSFYELDAGYVGYTSVLTKLREVWSRGATSKESMIANSNDRNLMNAALAAAANLGPQPPAFFSDRTLVSGVYDDLGYVDFIRIAFGLFGLDISAMYYLYFLLLTLSAAAFLIVFQKPTAQLLLLLALFAYLIELSTDFFHFGMPSFPGMRHGSTLALIPAWHLAMLVVYRTQLRPVAVVATIIQLAILILSIRVRGSALWIPVFLIAAAVGFACWRSRPRQLWSIGRAALTWPIIILLGAMAANSIYSRSVLHPIYFTDDSMPKHWIWHNIYLGLLGTPEMLTPTVRDFISKGIGGDAIGAVAMIEYLDESQFLKAPDSSGTKYPPSFISPWTGMIKVSLNDELMRRIVVHSIREHPFRALYTFAVQKPLSIFRVLYQYAFTNVALVLIFLAAIFAVVFNSILRVDTAETRAALAVAGLALAASALPSLIAAPGVSSLVDLILVLFVVAPLSVSAIAHKIGAAPHTEAATTFS